MGSVATYVGRVWGGTGDSWWVSGVGVGIDCWVQLTFRLLILKAALTVTF